MRRMYSKEQLERIAQEQAKVVKKDIATLVDSQGHDRFIEGDIEIEEIAGVTKKYGKWSLSGTHLMLVIAVDIDNNVQITNNSPLAYVELPAFIFKKIKPLWSGVVGIKVINSYGEDFSIQSYTIVLNKDSENMRIRTGVNPLTTQTRHLRIEFDLLIDNE